MSACSRRRSLQFVKYHIIVNGKPINHKINCECELQVYHISKFVLCKDDSNCQVIESIVVNTLKNSLKSTKVWNTSC